MSPPLIFDHLYQPKIYIYIYIYIYKCVTPAHMSMSMPNDIRKLSHAVALCIPPITIHNI